MSLDSYATLGRSGLRVSPFCLGTMTFGEDWGWGSSPAESEAIPATYLNRDRAPGLAFAGATVDGRRTAVLPLLAGSAARY